MLPKTHFEQVPIQEVRKIIKAQENQKKKEAAQAHLFREQADKDFYLKPGSPKVVYP